MVMIYRDGWSGGPRITGYSNMDNLDEWHVENLRDEDKHHSSF